MTTLANQTPFGGKKEPLFDPLNQKFEAQRSAIAAFLERISSVWSLLPIPTFL